MAHDRLISQKFPDKDEAAIARAFLDALGPGLRDDQASALIHELAAPMDLTPEAHLQYINSFLTQGLGLPSYYADRMSSWVGADFPGAPRLAPEAPSAPFETEIESLWTDEASRAEARRFVDHFAEAGMDEHRIRTTMREAVVTDRAVAAGTMTAEDARAHLARVATLGATASLADAVNGWFRELPPAQGAAEQPEPALPVETAPPPAVAPPPAPQGPSRADLQAKATAHLSDMNAAPGSEAWNRYFRGGGQAEYYTVLQALEGAEPAALQTE